MTSIHPPIALSSQEKTTFELMLKTTKKEGEQGAGITD
jgi:hypothetical protein